MIVSPERAPVSELLAKSMGLRLIIIITHLNTVLIVCQKLCSVFCTFINSFTDEPAYLVPLIYIFQVENWCPHLPWRAKNPYEEADHNSLVSEFGNLLLGS